MEERRTPRRRESPPRRDGEEGLRILEEMTKEQLIRVVIDDAKNWLAHDGLWFQAVEAAHGMDAAIEADRAAWERFTVIEARRIMDRLGMRPGEVFRPWWSVSCTDSTPASTGRSASRSPPGAQCSG